MYKVLSLLCFAIYAAIGVMPYRQIAGTQANWGVYHQTWYPAPKTNP
jgi:hypothetical protein